MYIDLMQLVNMVGAFNGAGGLFEMGANVSSSLDESDPEVAKDKEQASVGFQLAALMPSTRELIQIMRNQGLNVTSNNTLVLDVYQILNDNFNLTEDFELNLPSPINFRDQFTADQM